VFTSAEVDVTVWVWLVSVSVPDVVSVASWVLADRPVIELPLFVVVSEWVMFTVLSTTSIWFVVWTVWVAVVLEVADSWYTPLTELPERLDIAPLIVESVTRVVTRPWLLSVAWVCVVESVTWEAAKSWRTELLVFVEVCVDVVVSVVVTVCVPLVSVSCCVAVLVECWVDSESPVTVLSVSVLWAVVVVVCRSTFTVWVWLVVVPVWVAPV
jgi:hypothetical protein